MNRNPAHLHFGLVHIDPRLIQPSRLPPPKHTHARSTGGGTYDPFNMAIPLHEAWQVCVCVWEGGRLRGSRGQTTSQYGGWTRAGSVCYIQL